jgi:hypothetical protein
MMCLVIDLTEAIRRDAFMLFLMLMFGQFRLKNDLIGCWAHSKYQLRPRSL